MLCRFVMAALAPSQSKHYPLVLLYQCQPLNTHTLTLTLTLPLPLRYPSTPQDIRGLNQDWAMYGCDDPEIGQGVPCSNLLTAMRQCGLKPPQLVERAEGAIELRYGGCTGGERRRGGRHGETWGGYG